MLRGPRLHFAALVGAAWSVLSASCAPECPEGYVAELDQCLKEVPPHPCEVLPETKADETTVMSRIDYSQGRCRWMDQTEVTAGAYAQWLEDEPDFDDWEPTYCAWKTGQSDPASDPSLCDEPISPFDRNPFAANKPMRCVDFCDAEAYCRAHGKHLCYDANTFGTTYPRGISRFWRIACTNDVKTLLPWGDEPDDSRCRSAQLALGCPDNSCGPAAVGQYPRCKTDSGVLDLIGNVAEWTFGCNPIDVTDPTCLVRGGSYDDSEVYCGDERFVSARAHLPDIGFRCCSELTPSERAMIE